MRQFIKDWAFMSGMGLKVALRDATMAIGFGMVAAGLAVVRVRPW